MTYSLGIVRVPRCVSPERALAPLRGKEASETGARWHCINLNEVYEYSSTFSSPRVTTTHVNLLRVRRKLLGMSATACPWQHARKLSVLPHTPSVELQRAFTQGGDLMGVLWCAHGWRVYVRVPSLVGKDGKIMPT